MGRTKKFRGRRTHGRGEKAGRGKGKRGGHGNAGLHKHKFILLLKTDRYHFGRYGFKRHVKLPERRCINVGDLHRIAPEGTLNLTELGYHKLLGTGTVKGKYTITVEEATERAVSKIEAAGGTVKLNNQ